jgi:hypothetical protein
MTARRNDTGAALGKAFARPTARRPPVEEVPVPVQTRKATHAGMSKYTVLLDGETAAAFDELALIARRRTGVRIEKSALLRVLIRLAADDAALREQVIDEVTRG